MRDASQGYSQPTSVKQGYALTENDTNSLKHTWFRKLDSKQGRFTSPDPYAGSMSISNPQSFNRYSYVENDPLNFVDPSGLNMEPVQVCGTYRWAEFTPDGQFVQWRGNAFEQCHTEWMWIPNSGGGGGGDGVTPLPDLDAGLKDVLSNPDCAKFVSGLISATGAATKNPAHSTNALTLFGMLKGVEFGRQEINGQWIGGTVGGYIKDKDAVIKISPLAAWGGESAHAANRTQYVMTALHETIHQAGTNAWYSDEALAVGANSLMTPAQRAANPLPNRANFANGWDYTKAVSRYWDDELKRHCNPTKK